MERVRDGLFATGIRDSQFALGMAPTPYCNLAYSALACL